MWRDALALLALALVAPSCGKPEPIRLLLLLSVDTLRADHLGAYGSERGLTPHLDALAEQSVVFTAAYAPASFTLPSVAALLTARHPQALGLWSNESRLPDSAPTLADELRRRGWRTAAVVSNFVLRRGSGLAAGFDVFDDEFPQWEATRGWPERIASDTTDAALATLDACGLSPDDRCFLWVHYQDPHGPYDPPDGRRARHLERERRAPGGERVLSVRRDHMGMGGIPRYQFLDGQREVAFYRAGYDGEVEFVDEQIGRLLEGLDERGLARSTAMVFAADHGESLGEGDYWFAHGETLSEPLVRVPLFVRAPHLSPAERADVVSLLDVRPTLIGLVARDEVDPGPWGRDLLAPGAAERERSLLLATLGGSTVRRYAVVEGEYKLLLSEGEDGWDAQLVRRESEERDLRAAAPQIAAALRERLAALLKEVDLGAEEQRQELTPADRARLRALGYLE